MLPASSRVAALNHLPRISGLRMTEPICRRACCPAFCTFTWESVSTSVSLGTMLGRQEDNCLGAQKAMAPSSSTEPGGQRVVIREKVLSLDSYLHSCACQGFSPAFVLQDSSSRATSREGRTSFTPWALRFLITALAQSSAAWWKRRHVTRSHKF